MVIEYILGGIALIAILFIIWLIASYNGFVSKRNNIDNAWAQIDVQAKKRFDLIPNLVETVKGYAKHEKSVFIDVTKARASMASAKTPEDYAKSQNMITDALKTLFAVTENYPQLQANQNFLDLQTQLTEIEARIAYARQFYNDNVVSFNKKVQQFPSNLVAKMFHFTEKPYFGIAEQERQPVKVSF